jgi:hypothetical protein
MAAAPDPDADATDAGGGTPQTAEPGAIDNRLSLDPSDDRWKGYVDEWKDGKSYTVTMKVSQISPGEFEVEEITEAAPADEAEPKPGEGEGDAPAPEISTTSDNPAVQNLMKE